jgi:threonine aldolase
MNHSQDKIDLRSDTVTHPTEAMLEAMKSAPLGDDVMGEDPTINLLEEESARLLGKDAAIFVPSGTMANSIAIGAQTRPGDEILLMEDSHIFLYEAGGSARLWGVHPRSVPSTSGCLTAEDIESRIRPDDPHQPITSMVCLENTHNMAGGVVVTPEQMAPVVAAARQHSLRLHLDGARLFHAQAALDVPASELVRDFDSISFCLSKGLSCPVGSMLCGDQKTIDEAHRLRKLLGGGMRQAGVLAAAGRIALEESVPRLKEDHRRCQTLAEGLSQIPGVEVYPNPTHSNILFIRREGCGAEDYDRYQNSLEERGVRVFSIGPRGLRAVVHRQIDDLAIDRALEAFKGEFTA